MAHWVWSLITWIWYRIDGSAHHRGISKISGVLPVVIVDGIIIVVCCCCRRIARARAAVKGLIRVVGSWFDLLRKLLLSCPFYLQCQLSLCVWPWLYRLLLEGSMAKYRIDWPVWWGIVYPLSLMRSLYSGIIVQIVNHCILSNGHIICLFI